MRYGSVVQATSAAALYSWLVRAPSAPVSTPYGRIAVALDGGTYVPGLQHGPLGNKA
jgi:hypothetical protein